MRLLVTFGEKRMGRFPDVPYPEGSRHRHPAALRRGAGGAEEHARRGGGKLHDAFKQAMEQPGFRNALAQYYMEPVYMSSARYQQFAVGVDWREKQMRDAIGFVREK